VPQVLERALGRDDADFNEDVVLVGLEDKYLGMIPVPSLVRLQSALVLERSKAQEVLHRKLLSLSRQAGMAEVATGVLHNVGNVLNSVNVSASLVHDLLRKAKVASLEKAALLIEDHRADLGNYLQNDPKGKLIPDLLTQLASRLRSEQKDMLRELDLLIKHIQHIKSIVAMQQSYAKVAGVFEPIAPAALVEDALEMNAEAFVRHAVQIHREFEDVPRVVVDRHKVLQILTNLLRNAKYAVGQNAPSDKRLTVRIRRSSQEKAEIIVADNGVGIASDNLSKIFSHGYTTKKDGHGFGLHSAALAAKEMGGALHAHSDGMGKGAAFTLELVVDKSEQIP
jgi:signal transduction histidine kinase